MCCWTFCCCPWLCWWPLQQVGATKWELQAQLQQWLVIQGPIGGGTACLKIRKMHFALKNDDFFLEFCISNDFKSRPKMKNLKDFWQLKSSKDCHSLGSLFHMHNFEWNKVKKFLIKWIDLFFVQAQILNASIYDSVHTQLQKKSRIKG